MGGEDGVHAAGHSGCISGCRLVQQEASCSAVHRQICPSISVPFQPFALPACSCHLCSEVVLALAAAQKEPKPPLSAMFTDVYAEMPWHRELFVPWGLGDVAAGNGGWLRRAAAALSLLLPLLCCCCCCRCQCWLRLHPHNHLQIRSAAVREQYEEVLAHVKAHPDACPADIPIR